MATSGLADGAGTVVIGSERYVKEHGIRPRAPIKAMTTIGSDPVLMLTAPAPASEKALRAAGMRAKDIDLWEINEAFAAVVLQTMRKLDIDPARVNVNGGAIALGHPLGATGAMLLGTALDELERTGKQTALITMCIGGGQGTRDDPRALLSAAREASRATRAWPTIGYVARSMIDPRPCFSTFGVSGVARVLHHLRVLGAVGAALLALTLSRSASAAVTTPFPGVVLVDDGDRSLAIADLCAPGVSVRATAYAERKATPEQWANNAAVNADVAVNADFFDFPGWTYVVGRARGAGQDWPAGQQLREVRSYWQFGPGIAGSVEPANVAPAAGVTEIVGGHNTIIRGGKSLAPSFDGDSVILGTYRRTGIGLDATHAHLYLFASNTALSGTGMAAAMIQLAAEGNAPAIDVATNEDGGGSSQMYVRGKSQIIDSGRQVNNHLGILAKGGGAAPMCPNAAPRGAFDGVDCTHVFGWAQDPSTPTAAIAAHLYFNGAAGAVGATGISVPADVGRGDLVAAVGSPNHGFDAPTPFGLFDGKEHPIFAYAIDSQGGANTQLGTHSVTCAAAAPPSVRRHVVSPDSFTAWKFSGFQDLLPLDEATVTAFAPASDVDLAPVLFVSDDKTKTEVWLQDSVTKRHVVSVASAASWRFDLSKLATKPADVVNAMPTGPALRTRPLLARTADGAVWLLDDRSVVPGLPPDDDAGAGPGGGGGGIAAGDGGSTPGNGDTATDDSSGCSTARSIGSSRAGATVLGGLLVGGFVLVARRRKR